MAEAKRRNLSALIRRIFGREKVPICFAIGHLWGALTAQWVMSTLGDDEYSWLAVLSHENLAPVLTHARPRFTFFLNWSHYVPPRLLTIGAPVNFHCARLPYGRGGHPIENLILRGHAETVITAHQMTAEMDAGPIYGQSEAISLAGTKEQILARFIQPTANLIVQIMNGELQPMPQEGEPTIFHRLKREDYEAFWIARGGRV